MPIKIIDLQSEDAPSDDDLIIIRDNASGTTRKITRTKLFENPPLAASSITTLMIGDEQITKAKLAADAKISVRSNVISNTSSLTPASDDYDMIIVTTLASNMTINAPTGTPVNGQGLLLRIHDNGSSRTLTWNSIYRAIGVTVPTSTTSGDELYVACRYNSQAVKWDVLSVGRQ